MRPDWAPYTPQIVQSARDAVSLYMQLDEIFAPLKGQASQREDNRSAERAEAIANFEDDLHAGAFTADILREQLQSSNPQPKIVEQNGHVFRALAHSAKRFLITHKPQPISGADRASGWFGRRPMRGAGSSPRGRIVG